MHYVTETLMFGRFADDVCTTGSYSALLLQVNIFLRNFLFQGAVSNPIQRNASINLLLEAEKISRQIKKNSVSQKSETSDMSHKSETSQPTIVNSFIISITIIFTI
jgi:hypothetical protein